LAKSFRPAEQEAVDAPKSAIMMHFLPTRGITNGYAAILCIPGIFADQT
jgi:hypothetical protein